MYIMPDNVPVRFATRICRTNFTLKSNKWNELLYKWNLPTYHYKRENGERRKKKIAGRCRRRWNIFSSQFTSVLGFVWEGSLSRIPLYSKFLFAFVIISKENFKEMWPKWMIWFKVIIWNIQYSYAKYRRHELGGNCCRVLLNEFLLFVRFFCICLRACEVFQFVVSLEGLDVK